MCLACRRSHAKQKMRNRQMFDPKQVRQYLIDIGGGCCARCGYNEFVQSLEFHHLEPKRKESSIGDLVNRFCYGGTEDTFKALCSEVNKCVVLCSNCHQALHNFCIDSRKLRTIHTDIPFPHHLNQGRVEIKRRPAAPKKQPSPPKPKKQPSPPKEKKQPLPAKEKQPLPPKEKKQPSPPRPKGPPKVRGWYTVAEGVKPISIYSGPFSTKDEAMRVYRAPKKVFVVPIYFSAAEFSAIADSMIDAR
jgi:hypothetical protein